MADLDECNVPDGQDLNESLSRPRAHGFAHQLSATSPSSKSRCRFCGEDITQSTFLEAMGRLWHCSCFRCTICNMELSHIFYERNGKPYCTTDFFTEFGSLCDVCSHCITGPMMCAGENCYHPECFMCQKCGHLIGEGEAYALVDRQRLLCGDCFCYQQSSALENARTALTLVRLPPQTDKNATLLLDTSSTKIKAKQKHKKKLAFFSIKRILFWRQDRHSSVGLKEGDNILEVNGVAVGDRSLAEVQDLIQSKIREGLTLTVERQLTPASNKKAVPRSASINGCHDVQKRGRGSTESLNVSVSRTVEGKMFATRVPFPSSAVEDDEEEVALARSTPAFRESGVMQQAVSRQQSAPISPSSRSSSLRSSPQQEPLSPGPMYDTDIDVDNNPHQHGDSDLMRNASRSSDVTSASVPDVQWVKQYPHRCQYGERDRTNTLPVKMSRVNQSALLRSPLIRGQSFISVQQHAVFRPCDLEIGEVLGSGFFGRCLKVTNKSTDAVMVMKELTRCDDESRQNFLKEVHLLKSLEHRNVMNFIGIMYRDCKLHVIMEFISGGTLADRIMDKEQSLPYDLRVSFASDIASGMAYLHEHTIIHRDLTSNNCMIRGEDLSVVVGDFGLARVNYKNSESLQVVGSPFWMAPEMMFGKIYDCRADLFSFGIIMCELIGRISADPDEMPRTEPEFGLDEKAFREAYLGNCPENVFEVAALCCNVDPAKRPQFVTITVYLNALANAMRLHIDFSQSIDDFRSTDSSSSPTGQPEDAC